MKRTRPATLGLLVLTGGAIAWMLNGWMTTTGRPTIVPAFTMAITLVAISVLLLVAGWPIRRYTRDLRARSRETESRPDRDADRASESRDERDDASSNRPASPREKRSDVTAPDPFYARRVLACAQAGSLAGSLMAGACLSILGFVLSRSYVPAGSAWQAGVCAAASALLVIAGLVVESWCALPPDDLQPAE
mgnify:CR=1 FL=1